MHCVELGVDGREGGFVMFCEMAILESRIVKIVVGVSGTRVWKINTKQEARRRC